MSQVDISSGQRIGDLEVGDRLGEGVLGPTFEARTDDGQLKVLKVLEQADFAYLLQSPYGKRLRSDLPGVVRVESAGVTDGVPHLVRPHVDAPSLTSLLRGVNPPTPLAVLRAARDVLGVLARTGLVHGNLRPGNIFLPGDGVTLTDPGLAEIVRRLAPEEFETYLLGKVVHRRYVPSTFYRPADAEPTDDLDGTIDACAVAAILVQALGGNPVTLQEDLDEGLPDWLGPDLSPVLHELLEGDLGTAEDAHAALDSLDLEAVADHVREAREATDDGGPSTVEVPVEPPSGRVSAVEEESADEPAATRGASPSGTGTDDEGADEPPAPETPEAPEVPEAPELEEAPVASGPPSEEPPGETVPEPPTIETEPLAEDASEDPAGAAGEPPEETVDVPPAGAETGQTPDEAPPPGEPDEPVLAFEDDDEPEEAILAFEDDGEEPDEAILAFEDPGPEETPPLPETTDEPPTGPADRADGPAPEAPSAGPGPSVEGDDDPLFAEGGVAPAGTGPGPGPSGESPSTADAGGAGAPADEDLFSFVEDDATTSPSAGTPAEAGGEDPFAFDEADPGEGAPAEEPGDDLFAFDEGGGQGDPFASGGPGPAPSAGAPGEAGGEDPFAFDEADPGGGAPAEEPGDDLFAFDEGGGQDDPFASGGPGPAPSAGAPGEAGGEDPFAFDEADAGGGAPAEEPADDLFAFDEGGEAGGEASDEDLLRFAADPAGGAPQEEPPPGGREGSGSDFDDLQLAPEEPGPAAGAGPPSESPPAPEPAEPAPVDEAPDEPLDIMDTVGAVGEAEPSEPAEPAGPGADEPEALDPAEALRLLEEESARRRGGEEQEAPSDPGGPGQEQGGPAPAQQDAPAPPAPSGEASGEKSEAEKAAEALSGGSSSGDGEGGEEKDFGLVISGIGVAKKKEKAARIIADVQDLPMEEAMKKTEKPVITVLKKVSEEEANRVLELFKAEGLTARVTSRSRRRKRVR